MNWGWEALQGDPGITARGWEWPQELNMFSEIPPVLRFRGSNMCLNAKCP